MRAISRDEFIRGVGGTNERLDKIIELLELRNSIERAKTQMKEGEYAPAPSFCTCHKKGKTTATETCPIHG